MAKRKAKATTSAEGPAPAQGDGQGQAGAETVSGYFRKLFEQNPKWLAERSNQALLDRWLRDHPGQQEVPEPVKQNLANVKSVLRKKLREKSGGAGRASQPAAAASPAEAPRQGVRRLESLEEQIDECLVLAKELDREGLASVIALLRRARNEVVWKMGE
jgi:hypothetical protein